MPVCHRTLRRLNLARSQIFTAAIILIKNAMDRMGAKWDDDLGMEAAFGESLHKVGQGKPCLSMAAVRAVGQGGNGKTCVWQLWLLLRRMRGAGERAWVPIRTWLAAP